MSSPSANSDATAAALGRQYTVVARRYRPQTFAELIGQEHVAQALGNAISGGRVGHAYLFTGARGVGKTSAARIFAKALNCTSGPAPAPCNQCDICRSISSGEDVDVLEIDGASNRGIDEIRTLRQNVSVRPSRARFKIYIIDEVHMLTREAFNALLKTLEEPPEHVKFIFCTTDPQKIPVTILSRCQRFDFAGIVSESIAVRLRQIVEAEGMSAEPEALEELARRAAGSMRDGQSLLEQLLAFAPERITLADVQAMLGTADQQRLDRLVSHLVGRDAAGALAELDAALDGGVDVGQLLEQLLGYLRDAMAAAAGCPAERLIYASAESRQRVIEIGEQWGLQTILAGMQILDQTLLRLRQSTQGRILAELALARICGLADLDALGELIAELREGSAGGTGPESKKKADRVATPVAGAAAANDPPSGESFAGRVEPLTAQNAAAVWSRVLEQTPGLAAQQGRRFERVAILAPNHLVVSFRGEYTLAKSACERPEQTARFERALAEITGQRVRLEFALLEEGKSEPIEAPAAVSPQQRMREVVGHPMIRRAGELFGAQPLRVDPPAKTTE